MNNEHLNFEATTPKKEAREPRIPSTADGKRKLETDVDWDDLRKRSLEPGGFGESRVSIWPRLLNASSIPATLHKLENADASLKTEDVPHKDERQIKLDTDRSFVLYPVVPPGITRDDNREKLQSELHELLVALFRKRPKLSYFQGYHDIITVLFLTLPPEMQLVCAEKLSLHRVRDSMGSSLEPVLGLLRITKNLLRLIDPEYTTLLEENSPLPFYALSNLLTLFSHDMPTLSLIQHVFDYLLCRPPICAVYLATALILIRKDEVYRLQLEREDGMIHSLLSGLPDIVDEIDKLEDYEPLDEKALEENTEATLPELLSDPVIDEVDSTASIPPLSAPPFDPLSDSMETQTPSAQPSPTSAIRMLQRSDDSPSLIVKETVESQVKPLAPVADVSTESVRLDISVAGSLSASTPQSDVSDETSTSLNKNPDISVTSSGAGEDDVATALPLDVTSAGGQGEGTNPSPPEESSPPSRVSTPDPLAAPRPKVALVSLLTLADALYEKHPPSDPGLAASSIMGPQSVIFTWSEDFSQLPNDDMAEAMVMRPELVVYPYIDDDADIESSKEEENVSAAKNQKRKRRKLRKSRFSRMEKRTMITGAVVVLGVAMAVYGIKARSGTTMYDVQHIHAHREQLRRLGGWASGVLVGMSAKLLGGLKG